MFSPSDFNSAVPQFTNGNYANNPLSPLYIEEPGAIDYNRGVEPLQTLPAQWWNWLGNQFTSKLNKLNIYVKNIFDELTQLLSLVGVTPDATEGTITTGQVKDAFETRYPNFLSKFIHTIAEAWSYIGTTVVGDVTTTQTSKLAIFDHVNTSDASTTPPTVTDEYKTKYVDNLPVSLGGTGAKTASDAMLNLVSPLNTISGNTGLITDEVLFERNLLGEHFVKKMTLTELARLMSSVSVNVPVVPASSTVITGTNLSVNEVVHVWFTADINGVDTTTPLEVTWNGNTVPIKAVKDGLLVDILAVELINTSPSEYRYIGSNTVVPLLFDGTNLVCVENTMLLEYQGIKYYANGDLNGEDCHLIGVEIPTGRKWSDGSMIYKRYVYEQATVSTNYSYSIDITLAPSNMSKPLSIKGYAYSSGVNARMMFGMGENSSYSAVATILPTGVRLVCSDGHGGSRTFIFEACIEYAKVTS